MKPGQKPPLPGAATPPKMPREGLEAAWERASKHEKLKLIRLILDMLLSDKNPLEESIRDVIPHRGKKPRPPAPTCPKDLLILVKQYGWNFHMIARKLGVGNVHSVGQWWSGKYSPSPRFVQALADLVADLQQQEQARKDDSGLLDLLIWLQALPGDSPDPSVAASEDSPTPHTPPATDGAPGPSQPSHEENLKNPEQRTPSQDS